MKTFIPSLVILLILPNFISSQVRFHYNVTTNTLSSEYLGCGSCEYGTIGSYVCQCRKNCNKPGIEYKNCIKECTQLDNPAYEPTCIEQCENQYMTPYLECLNNCGPEPEPLNQLYGYFYELIVNYEELGVDPYYKYSNFSSVIVPGPGLAITSSNVKIYDWNPPAPWPGVYTTHNTCFAIKLTLIYQTPTGLHLYCTDEIWTCNILG
ncbi:MAG: hypothetical protein R2769_04650 [Saprospiraceae bacterium]